MKWIYGEARDILLEKTVSYKINPKYIIAADLNKRVLLVQDLDFPLHYTEDWDKVVYDLVMDSKED